MSDIFDAKNLSPREQVSEWVNIKTNIGDNVSGTFQGWWEAAGQDGFKDQIGLAIKRTDGVIVGVNCGDNTYFRGKLATTQLGDEIGLRYEGDKDTGQIQKAKIIKFYNKSQTEREEKGEKSIGVEASVEAPSETPVETGPGF